MHNTAVFVCYSIFIKYQKCFAIKHSHTKMHWYKFSIDIRTYHFTFRYMPFLTIYTQHTHTHIYYTIHICVYLLPMLNTDLYQNKHHNSFLLTFMCDPFWYNALFVFVFYHFVVLCHYRFINILVKLYNFYMYMKCRIENRCIFK